MRNLQGAAACLFVGMFCAGGCASDSQPSGAGGSGTATGGAGAYATGGTSASTGGTSASTGGTSASTGGTINTGGFTGGAAGSGGLAGASTGMGGSSGGATNTGGTGTGGTAGTGGSTGGTAGTGGSTGGTAGAGGSTGTCPGGGWAAGKQTINTQWGGVARQYVVYVPPGYTGTTPVPLMLVIHGAHNTPGMVESWSQMDTVANQNGFIIAYPAGLDCWNAGLILPGCTAADDDFGFLKNVVAEVESHACIDPKRVYATGISNGSIMAQYMGCHAADIFAAVGGVAGGVIGGCAPSRPISVFYVLGTADQTVGYDNGANAASWASRNHCSSAPVQVYSQGSTTCIVYQGCDQGVEVEFCSVTGMGHCWPEDTRCAPQPGYGVTDFKASPMMWDFFQRHPLL